MLLTKTDISVIIPNYNHSKFLKKRIDSVLNQTYQNIEVIILDDCSTDNSKEVIEQYRSNEKVSNIIFNDKNSGSTFIQWQKGIEFAKGKYIWIAESDDYSDIHFLEEVIKRFNNDLEVGIVFCDSNIVKDECIDFDFYKKYRNETFNTDRWNSDYITSGSDEINNFLIFDCTINNTSAMVFKKSLVDQQIFKNLGKFRYSGDWYFFLCLAQDCKISYIKTALNYFRQGTNNFKKGIKSPLNHFKERSMVRYLILKDFTVSNITYKQVFKQMGSEFKFKFFELIKHPANFAEFYTICKQLAQVNKQLFLRQIIYAFKINNA